MHAHIINFAYICSYQKFSGKVSDLICKSGKSAQKLVQLLATNFPSYCDISTYNGQTGGGIA